MFRQYKNIVVLIKMVLYVTLDKGTMFGGKSSMLYKYYRQYMKKKSGGKHLRITVIKHTIDTRYGGDTHIITHDGKKVPCTRISSLMDIDPREWDVIMIDEGQFFPDLYKWLEMYFRAYDTHVHIAGLNGDKQQKNFGDINTISPFLSEERVHYGMCAVCGDSAPFTRYRGDSDEQAVVGDDNDYYTVCRRHLDIPSQDIEMYVNYAP
jgi:thymidine kinase